MKIAIDARILGTSTGRYVERLLHYLQELDHEHEYIVLLLAKDFASWNPTNQNFRKVTADFDSYSFAEQTGLLRLLNSLRVDLVHFCMPQQPLLYRGAHVTTVHDLNLLHTYNSDKNFIIYKLKQLVGRFVFYYIGHSSAYILCPTNYTGQGYQRYARLNSQKIALTYEGCDMGQIAAQEYTPLKEKPFIMYVGQQSDYKNVRRLIEAHHKLRSVHPDLLLVLVGRLSGKNAKPLLTNQAWAKNRGYEGVIFTDFVPDEQLAWLYQHCQAYVFPSLMEGFGLPGLEAMASGAPVVSSNATCLPEVYRDGAHYFNPEDVDEMAKKITDVLEDEDLRKKLINQGKVVVGSYSWRRMAEETLAIYRKALLKK